MKLSLGERLQGYRSARIPRPLDWLKQPFLDGQRALHRRLAALLPLACRAVRRATCAASCWCGAIV